MTFWSGLKFAYRESWAFVIACPLLALVPVLGEILQHMIEMHIGMYDNLDAATAADGDPMRMAFGFVKTLGLLLPGYWVMRFLAGGRDTAAARRIDPRAVQLFAWFFLFQAALTAIELFGMPRTGMALAAGTLFSLVLGPLLARWAAAAPLGIPIGPIGSARVMLRQLPWAIAFSIIVILPLMVPHYALGVVAILVAPTLKWPVLIADSLLVGYLSAVMIASTWVIATRRTPITEAESA